MNIDENLVQGLLSKQFPKWAELPVRRIGRQRHDNRTFRLGSDKSVRLPSGPAYAAHMVIEYRWLPELASRLPVQVPEPLALGQPDHDYPWPWLISRWIDGNDAETESVNDLVQFACELAGFLGALHSIAATGAPEPSVDNFFRGAHLSVYDFEIKESIERLADTIDSEAATEVWKAALESRWCRQPVWVHGDIAPSNQLVRNGQLGGVVDFGQLAAGDPACDLTIAWTFLVGESRRAFRDHLDLDEATWMKARGWALWKALVTPASHQKFGTVADNAERVVRDVLADLD